MVNKFHSKTNRYCHKCTRRHPIIRPCTNASSKKKPSLKHYGKMLNGYKKGFFPPTLDCIIIRDIVSEEASKKRRTTRVANKATHLHDPILGLKIKKRAPNPNTNTDKPKGECPVCLEDKSLIVLGCRHEMCRSCQDAMVANTGCQDQCPLCRTPMYNAEPVDYILYTSCPQRRGCRQYTLHKAVDYLTLE